MHFLQLGRVSEKSLGVNTLQDLNLENIGKLRVIYKLGSCITSFIDRRKLIGSMGLSALRQPSFVNYTND